MRIWARIDLTALVLAACLAALALLAPATATAQFTDTTKQQEISSAEIEVLVQSLQDPEARAKLIAQLKAMQAAQATAEGVQEEPGLGAMLLATLSDNVRDASDGLVAVATALLNAPRIVAWIAEQARDPAVRDLWFELIWKIAAILIAAMTIEWLVNRLFARPRQRLEGRQAENSYLWRLPYALLHLLLELIPIAAFLAIAYGVMSALAPGETTRLVVLAIINANLVTRLITAGARTALAPRARSLRLINVGDETANYLLIWIRRVSAVAVYGYFIAEAGLLLGLPPALHIFSLRAVGLVVVGMLVIFVLQNRSAVTQWLKARGENGAWNRLRNRFADGWHFLAIVYVVAVYCVWALNITGGFAFLFRATLLTFLLLFVVRMITAGISRMVERGFALSSELQARFPRLESRANRYLPLLQRILFAVIYVVTALSLLEVWGIDAYGWLATEFGQRLTRSLITIGFIFLGALLATELVNGIVESFLSKRQRDCRRSQSRRAAAHSAAADSQCVPHRAGGHGVADRSVRAGHQYRATAGRRRRGRPGGRLRRADAGQGCDHRHLHPGGRYARRGRCGRSRQPHRRGRGHDSPQHPPAGRRRRGAHDPLQRRHHGQEHDQGLCQCHVRRRRRL